MSTLAAALPPDTTRGRVARALLGALRCLHPDPERRGDPGAAYEALRGEYPYRWWLRSQLRRRGRRSGPTPVEAGLALSGVGPGDTFEPDAAAVLAAAQSDDAPAVVFHEDVGTRPGTVRIAATPGPAAWFALGGPPSPVASPGGSGRPTHWSACTRVDEVLLHRRHVPHRRGPRSPQPSVAELAVVVPSASNTAMLERLFAGLRSEDRVVEVVVVDNSPATDAAEWFYDRWSAELPLRVVRTDPGEEFNYSRANNIGARATTAPVLAFCNDDLEFIDHPSLARLAGWLEVPGIGVAGPQLRYANGTIQHGGVVLGLNGLAEHAFTGMQPGSRTLIGSTDDPRDVSAVTGACLLTRRDVFEATGGFDEELRLTGSDVWYCLVAARAGEHCVYDGTVALVHHESVSRLADNPLADVLGSARRWGHLLAAGDPYWSQRLAIHRHEPTLRRPGDPTSESMLLDHLLRRGATESQLAEVTAALGGAPGGGGAPAGHL